MPGTTIQTNLVRETVVGTVASSEAESELASVSSMEPVLFDAFEPTLASGESRMPAEVTVEESPVPSEF